MKKLLTIAALIGAASVSFGQGYVSFFNGSTSRVSTNSVADAHTGGSTPVLHAAIAGGVAGYYYALVVAPTTTTTIDPTLAGWSFSGSYGTNTATAGRMAGFNNADLVGASVAGFAAGTTANFAVVSWSASVGTTYAQALAWWNNGNPFQNEAIGVMYNFGISAIATGVGVAPSGGPYNDVWGASSSGLIQGMVLGSYLNVPEPSTFALAGLGAAALLIFRRRK